MWLKAHGRHRALLVRTCSDTRKGAHSLPRPACLAPDAHTMIIELFDPPAIPLLGIANASYWGSLNAAGNLELEDNPGVCTHPVRVRILAAARILLAGRSTYTVRYTVRTSALLACGWSQHIQCVQIMGKKAEALHACACRAAVPAQSTEAAVARVGVPRCRLLATTGHHWPRVR